MRNIMEMEGPIVRTDSISERKKSNCFADSPPLQSDKRLMRRNTLRRESLLLMHSSIYATPSSLPTKISWGGGGKWNLAERCLNKSLLCSASKRWRKPLRFVIAKMCSAMFVFAKSKGKEGEGGGKG